MSEQTNQTNELPESDLGTSVIPVSSLEAIQRAEVDIAIATAKRYPRDISRSLKTCKELALRNPGIAATCNYVIPRGGKRLIGPSVHFARIVSYAWGNNTAIARVVGCDRENAHVQGVFHDLQTNSRIGIEMDWPVQPPHEDSPKRWADQMNLAKRAGGAVALRTAIFNCVPMVLFDDIAQEAKMVAVGQGKTFEESRNNAIRICKEKGISQPMLYATLNVGGLESITIDHLIWINALLQSVADGTMTIAEAFGTDKLAPVKAQVPTKKPSSTASTATATPPKETPPEAPAQQTSSPKSTTPSPVEQPQPPAPMTAAKPKAAEKPHPQKRAEAQVEAGPANLVAQVRKKLQENGIAEQAVIDWMDNLGVVKSTEVKIDEVNEKWLRMLLDKWEENVQHFRPVSAEPPWTDKDEDVPF